MEIIFTSLLAFASTNFDDIFILALFFGSTQFSDKQIVLGQFVGIGALIAVSWIGSFIGLVVSPAYIGLLGMMPIYLGVRSILRLAKKPREDLDLTDTFRKKENPYPILFVASITIANGGDNISIYIPLFATLSLAHQLPCPSLFGLDSRVVCFGKVCYPPPHC